MRVNVANYAGRENASDPQLVLTTKYGTQIWWGRPWTSVDNFIEVSPERKIRSMQELVAHFGRVDARQPWIDLRFDIKYPSPAPGSAGATAGGLP